MDITVLEIHLPGASIDTPFSFGETEPASETGVSEDMDGGGRGLRPLVVIAVIVGLALLARYLRGSGSDGG